MTKKKSKQSGHNSFFTFLIKKIKVEQKNQKLTVKMYNVTTAKKNNQKKNKKS
jgi:hypothetical protein